MRTASFAVGWSTAVSRKTSVSTSSRCLDLAILFNSLAYPDFPLPLSPYTITRPRSGNVSAAAEESAFTCLGSEIDSNLTAKPAEPGPTRCSISSSFAGRARSSKTASTSCSKASFDNGSPPATLPSTTCCHCGRCLLHATIRSSIGTKSDLLSCSFHAPPAQRLPVRSGPSADTPSRSPAGKPATLLLGEVPSRTPRTSWIGSVR